MPNPTKTQSIKNFLIAKNDNELTRLYNHDMECQVNVSQDGGDRISGEYKGVNWVGWTDGIQTWKSFRIPYKASTQPEFVDTEMKFDLKHAIAIGMTGWDWKNKVSRWVGFDFDAIIGHSDKHAKKLTYEELQNIQEVTCDVPWVTVRRSTSGTGLHLYIFLKGVPTANHTEHAGLARAILGMLSAVTGYDFASKVDVCGGNMWVWHRRQADHGLKLVRSGEYLENIPTNWRDHIKVIAGSRRKNLPQVIKDAGTVDTFETLCSQRHNVSLEGAHKKVIEYLKSVDALWWWDQDHHMLVTHTKYLEKAHNELSLRGLFDTLSEGKDLDTQNCFAHPLKGGSWAVRRFTLGVQESQVWEQDGHGWTRAFLNKEPDFITACRAFGGLEDEKGGFVFRELEVAMKAAQLLGAHIDVDPMFMGRMCTLRQHKDGRLIVQIDRNANDHADKLPGYLAQGTKPWSRIYKTTVTPNTEPELSSYDDLVRHLITVTDEDYGWMLKGETGWRLEPLHHIKPVLSSYGYSLKEVTEIIGSSVIKCWKVVNKPFQPEYTGDREWNRNAAQYRFPPSKNQDTHHPTWDKILDHCGQGLDLAIKEHPWCKVNGILTGGEYLKLWIASMFQQPFEPLPYLFFFGEQKSGKTVFHEALSLLFTKGYKRADIAIISQSGFNAELEGAILCVIEEIDLRANKSAYARIKDWVTSREILVHAKNKTPYMTANSTHWVQCSNDHKSCPIFAGDTRISMLRVDPLNPLDLIPRRKLFPSLEKESPDFLQLILNIEIPESNDRLFIPVIETQEKLIAEELNDTDLQIFIKEYMYHAPGYQIPFKQFYEKFIETCGIHESKQWTRKRVSMEISTAYPRGRIYGSPSVHIGNLSLTAPKEKRPPLKLVDGRLV